LVYSEYGNPNRVLKLEETPTGSSDKVHVKMLAAPINPADINMIQGTYGVSATFPAIGGNEGVGVVENPGNSSLRKGDWVIPASAGFGTWRTDSFVDADALCKVPNNIPVEYAATMAVNPCTAWRMLEDFVTLQSGDVVIQNGANSMVGLAVAQIAKARGIKVINVVRSRDNDTDKFVSGLKSQGLDLVITEEQLASSKEFASLTKGLPKPKLALNCVGGQSATNVARSLSNNGVMVTYGGMSRKPILVPTGALIFNNLTFRGFWMTRWNSNNPLSVREDMLNQIGALINEKKLKFNFVSFPLAQYEKALELSCEGRKDAKVLLKF